MKVKMDFSKFKKISQDKHHTIMEHEDGHTMKIAHSVLGHKMKTALDKLPMHESKYAKGGEVKDELKVEKLKKPEPKEHVDYEPAGDMDERHQDNKLEVEAMSDGGEVQKPKEEPKGQWVEKGSVPEKRKQASDSLSKAFGFDKKAYGGTMSFAEGGETVPVQTDPNQMQIPPQFQNPQALAPQTSAPSLVAPQAPAPQMFQSPQSGQQMSQSGQEMSQSPSLMGGYEKELSGIQAGAEAQGKLGQEQAKQFTQQAQDVNKMMQSYQDHFNDLEKERKAFQQDIIDKHIDPNRYMGSMDTMGKIQTSIGLILGGLGGGGQGNAALDFLNKQIDRDIESQKADLSKKETLLSANMRQFGNLRDATDMTKMMMNDQVINQLKAAEARAQNPMAKARAQQEIGKLEMQMAPVAQQFATRRMLEQVNQGGGQKIPESVTPESFVPSVVPEHAQKDVMSEISRAQNTRKAADGILKNFDKAAHQIQSGITGRIASKVYPVADKAALMEQLGATVSDQVGTVREKAMELAEHAYVPEPTDTAERIATKRAELAHYLQLKSAAPTAKAYGIDLNKFASTTRQMPAAAKEPVERITKDGRIALFDPTTKQFLKFK